MTSEELQRWMRGELPADAVVRVGRHLSDCGECRTLASTATNANLGTRQVRADLEWDAQAEEAPAPRWWWYAAAAVAAIIASGAFFTIRRDAPPHVSPVITATHAAPLRYERSDWSALIEKARAGQQLTMPDVLRNVRLGEEVLRDSSPAHAIGALSPVGVVIEEQQPTFTWPSPPGATSDVSLFRDGKEVASSPELRDHRWTIDRPLRRGVTYTWQVVLRTRDGEETIVPMPPASPARFHVLDERTRAELASARQAHPKDHLLLGLLYARAGLDARAAEELNLVDRRDAVLAARLKKDIESWSATAPSPAR